MKAKHFMSGDCRWRERWEKAAQKLRDKKEARRWKTESSRGKKKEFPPDLKFSSCYVFLRTILSHLGTHSDIFFTLLAKPNTWFLLVVTAQIFYLLKVHMVQKKKKKNHLPTKQAKKKKKTTTTWKQNCKLCTDWFSAGIKYIFLQTLGPLWSNTNANRLIVPSCPPTTPTRKLL